MKGARLYNIKNTHSKERKKGSLLSPRDKKEIHLCELMVSFVCGGEAKNIIMSSCARLGFLAVLILVNLCSLCYLWVSSKSSCEKVLKTRPRKLLKDQGCMKDVYISFVFFFRGETFEHFFLSLPFCCSRGKEDIINWIKGNLTKEVKWATFPLLTGHT